MGLHETTTYKMRGKEEVGDLCAGQPPRGTEGLRRILDEIGRQGWEIVLMTEIRADEKGVVWLGGDEERVAVIHSERAAIVLRGQALEEWIGEGQRKWLEERVVTVVLGGMRLVSVY